MKTCTHGLAKSNGFGYDERFIHVAYPTTDSGSFQMLAIDGLIFSQQPEKINHCPAVALFITTSGGLAAALPGAGAAPQIGRGIPLDAELIKQKYFQQAPLTEVMAIDSPTSQFLINNKVSNLSTRLMGCWQLLSSHAH